MTAQAMSQPTDSAKDRLNALKVSFLQSLPSRLASLDAADPARPDGLARVRDAAHQLAGTAPVFGLADVGRTAAAIEELAETALAGGRPLADGEGHSLRRLTEELGRQARSALAAAEGGA
jgi:HPt (histidine-containing phosphotransfer) domain-containing protein